MERTDYQVQGEWSRQSHTTLADMEYETLEIIDSVDYPAQGEWSRPSQTPLANVELVQQQEGRERNNSSDTRNSQDSGVTYPVSSSQSGDTLDRMLQIMLERERVREEEERRRRDEQRFQEERRREEERQQRQQDSQRWEELLKTVMSSTS